MIESVRKRLYFFFAFADFAVKLVTIALQLLSLLSSFDDKISLCVLTVCLNVPR